MINEKNYSDIFVIYASEGLLNNLKAQFGHQFTQIKDPELYNPFYRIESKARLLSLNHTLPGLRNLNLSSNQEHAKESI